MKLFEYNGLDVSSSGESIIFILGEGKCEIPYLEAKKLVFALLKGLDERDQLFISDLDFMIEEITGFSLMQLVNKK